MSTRRVDPQQNESNFIGKEPCPECGSKDNLARYDDGHGYCFGCGHYEPSTDVQERPAFTEREQRGRMNDSLMRGEARSLGKRGISEETCAKWKYEVGEYSTTNPKYLHLDGKKVQIANYCDEHGRPVAQKLRFPDKEMMFIGDTKGAGLYGQHLWRDGGKMVVVTEGEIDALTVSQLQGNKWPVVSVPTGSKGAKKALAKSIEWLLKFDSIVLMFDNDEPGMEAVAECATVFPPGRCKIAKLPLKDPNEMLQAGRGAEVIDAIWGAKVYRPDGLVEIDEILEAIEKPVEMGLPWCFPTLTKFTYGRRWGEVYGFGAGTGIGKTDLFTQQMAYDLTELSEGVGVIYLEAQPADTGKRIAGKIDGKRYHIPDEDWSIDQLRTTVRSLKGKVTFYDSWGETDWDVVKEKIRYMVVSQGRRLIYLDHLTAMADTSNERESLEQIMKEMAGLANELQCIIHFVSHLATPEGKPHEEGGRVMIRHFKGSRAIGFWSFFMFGMERNQQAENIDERQTTTFRILKDRYTGRSTGEVIYLGYDTDTGRLYEREAPTGETQTESNGDEF